MMVEDLQGTNLSNEVPEQSQPPIPPIKVLNDNNSNAEYTIMVGGDLQKEVGGVDYTIIVEKDLQKEIGSIETNSERTLGCGRPFIKTAALVKRYLKWENAVRKDDVEVLIKEVREAVRQRWVELGLIADKLKI